jgi:hypothetical protein
MRSLILLPVVAATAAAQQVPTRAFAKPEVEYAEPFSQLNALAELRDGRVVVADLRDKTLQAIDLRTKSATPIGREGAGPQEWNSITSLWGWKGDSVIANDVGNGRYLVIAPDGQAARTFTTASGDGAGRETRGGQSGRGGGGPRISGIGLAGGVDSRGRIYSQDLGIRLADDGTIASSDSAPIIRYDPSTQKTDTVAFVNLAPSAASGSARGDGRGNQTVSFRVGGGSPYAPADVWTVFRDGTVAIARANNYRVDIIQPNGRRIVGRAVPYTPVRIGDAEKQEWRDRMKNATAVIRTTGDGGRASNIAPPNLAQEPASWPEVKPPFEARSVFAAPNGDVWVMRTRPARDRIPKLDVFNAQGQLVGNVTLPERHRLVALGAKGVYTARLDEDDLQYLQRHAIQWTGCTPELRENCR